MSLRNDERGISVIIGTLMLILITIIAASGLALMVSGMQNDAMERESHLAAVASENLRIISIDPAGNSNGRGVGFGQCHHYEPQHRRLAHHRDQFEWCSCKELYG
ncbi:MAG: hypothetical protein BA871_04430 [Desulfuromonadales bacterium C00003096]|nr:MAG: hypothetical protein BA871_04430 [Desulfuromonadales bacterium C00003096]